MRVGRAVILAVALLLVLAAPLLALAQQLDDPRMVMRAANQSYEAGNYEEAIAGYQALTGAGIQSADVYYNLGNAYFKQGDVGRAILNYRRARALAPRDDDILTNLQIARAQTIDQIEVGEESFWTNWVKFAEEWLSIREQAMLALALWLVICGLALLGVLFPRFQTVGYWLMGIVGIFMAIGLISIASRFYQQEARPAVVIVAQKVDVTSGPGDPEQYLTEFILHSGAEAFLLESRPDWWRISLSGGELQGWVPADTVARVR